MNVKSKRLTMIAICTALCAVCAWIQLPFVVPFTLQTFAVFLACLVLGGKNAAISLTVYILIGVAGVPVFSGFRGGIGALIGPTGGYIVGFPILCLVYALITYLFKYSRLSKLVGLLIGLVVLYVFGTIWFVILYSGIGEMNFLLAISKCVLPFIIPDLLKLLLAFLVAKRLSLPNYIS